ncbi:unnamed protein product [Phytomonas sp. EM1]|nr:unnamed protein product [Phytomonas sp. EM1]|eukprot:CCW62387.1 unnamed protein product [Phytomonas sp. isolate EM1]
MRVILTFGRKYPLFLVACRNPGFRYSTTNKDAPLAGKAPIDENNTHTSYRRRSSDPQTLREREDFRRDTKYGRYRPLPDVPWLELKQKTYLDDAERLYGRIEEWHHVADDALREKLVAILQDYLRDTCAATRLEVKDAMKYQRLCEISAREYRSHVVSGAFHSVGPLREWVAAVVARQPMANKRNATSSVVRDGQTNSPELKPSLSFGHSTSTALTSTADLKSSSPPESGRGKTDFYAQQEQELRRRRGEEANLENTPAMLDLPESDLRRRPVSAFPFLRRRALEDEDSLDSSLVDWTAKYFPEDNKHTFEQLPKLRQDLSRATAEGSAEQASDDGAPGSTPNAAKTAEGGTLKAGNEDTHNIPRHHARHRLQRPLRSHEDRHRATFDGEGVFYHIRNLSEEDERAPKAKPVRGSDFMARPGVASKVVKIPWNVVSTAKQQGYSHNILKAKERLSRLSRGENPETIP